MHGGRHGHGACATAPQRIDFFALYDEAMSYAPTGELHGIDAEYVGSDGTVDVHARGYTPAVRFAFQDREALPAPVDPSLPLGSPKPPMPRVKSTCVTMDGTGRLHAEF